VWSQNKQTLLHRCVQSTGQKLSKAGSAWEYTSEAIVTSGRSETLSILE
jgi:hypothetical protein